MCFRVYAYTYCIRDKPRASPCAGVGSKLGKEYLCSKKSDWIGESCVKRNRLGINSSQVADRCGFLKLCGVPTPLIHLYHSYVIGDSCKRIQMFISILLFQLSALLTYKYGWICRMDGFIRIHA